MVGRVALTHKTEDRYLAPMPFRKGLIQMIPITTFEKVPMQYYGLNEILSGMVRCTKCGAVVYNEDTEIHQKFHETVWRLDPHHRILR